MKVRFQVLTAVTMKMAVFWVVAPCSLVEVYIALRGACRLHRRGDYNDVGSKHLCYVPEDSILQVGVGPKMTQVPVLFLRGVNFGTELVITVFVLRKLTVLRQIYL
jgi:hypothetical protein